MKRVALSLIVVLAALLSACEIAPTDTSGITVGATRATVEGVLGKPVKSVQTDSGKIDTYKYNQGYTPTPTGGSGGDYDLIAGLVILAVVGPIVHGVNYAGQRGDIEVAYGPDDTVVGLGWSPGNIMEAREARKRARKRHDELLARAEQGREKLYPGAVELRTT